MEATQSREVQSELYFLIAKFLRDQFPDFGKIFTAECEKRRLFPSRVFVQTPSFEQLDLKLITGIPDDQLLRLISLACPKSDFPSLFFSPQKPSRTVSMADSLIYGLGQPVSPILGMVPFQRVIGHTDKIFCLVVDLSSQYMITGSDDFTLKVWRLPEMVLHKTVIKHSNVITDISIHPENRYFAASSHDHTVTVFKFPDGEHIRTFEFADEVHCVKFSPCGKYMAAGGEEGKVIIWNTTNFAVALVIPVKSGLPVGWLDFSPGGSYLVFAADPDIIGVVHIEKKEMLLLSGHTSCPSYITFSKVSCGRILSISPKERGARQFFTKNGAWADTFSHSVRGPTGAKIRFVNVRWNCDETRVIGISSNLIAVWDGRQKRLLLTITHPIYTDHCVIVSPHPIHPYVAFISCLNGRGAIFDISTGQIINELFPEEGYKPTEAVWSPDGLYLYVSDTRDGVTCCGITSKGFTTMEQFTSQQVNETGYPEGTLFKSSGYPLVPQPVKRPRKPTLPAKMPDEELRASENDQYELWVSERENMKSEQLEDLTVYERVTDKSDEEDAAEAVDGEENEAGSGEEDVSSDFSEEETPIITTSSRRRSTRLSGRQDESEESDSSGDGESDRDQGTVRTSTGRISRRPRILSSSDDEPPRRRQIRPRTRRVTTEDTSTASTTETETDTTFSDTQLEYSSHDRISDIRVENTTRSGRRLRKVVRVSSDEEFDNSSLEQSEASVSSDSSDVEEVIETIESRRRSTRRTKVTESPNLNRSSMLISEDSSDYEDLAVITSSVPSWVFWSNPHDHPLFPQIGEEVYYFKGIHQHYAKFTSSLKIVKPYIKHKNLSDQALARLDKVTFFSNVAVMTLRFRFSSPFSVYVEYPIELALPFIVSKDTLEASVANAIRLSEGDEVTVRIIKDGKSLPVIASIVQVDRDIRKKPYDSVSIRIQDERGVIRVSPWQIAQTEVRARNSTKLQKAARDLVSTVQKLMADSDNEDFVDAPSKSDILNLIKVKIRPIWLGLILTRLTEGYYQHILQIFEDFKYLKDGAAICENQQQEDADRIYNQLVNSAKIACRIAGCWFPGEV